MTAASSPAAGGIGKPTKYRLSSFGVLPGTENRGALAITLNLANLSAPQIRKKNEIPHASFPSPVSYTHLTLPTIYSV